MSGSTALGPGHPPRLSDVAVGPPVTMPSDHIATTIAQTHATDEIRISDEKQALREAYAKIAR